MVPAGTYSNGTNHGPANLHPTTYGTTQAEKAAALKQE
jgi:hypothetical protein